MTQHYLTPNNLTLQQLRTYEKYAKAASDRTSEINGAYEDAHKEGYEIGLREARKQVDAKVLALIDSGCTLDEIKAWLEGELSSFNSKLKTPN
jgi:flagellar biosynthesis/type III secretory pathway protein FliH